MASLRRQLGVNKPADSPRMSPRPEDLRKLRQERSLSLAEFGLALRRALDAKATRGYTREYVRQLEGGLRPITPRLARALAFIAAAADDADPILAIAQPVTVYAADDRVAGALVTGEPRPCARPGCPVRFVPAVPWQKYHSKLCRLKYRKFLRTHSDLAGRH